MSAMERVTGFVAHYTQPEMDGTNWGQIKASWNQRALDAWLEVARQHGLSPTVLEIHDSHQSPGAAVGIVEVDGQEYVVTHAGRSMALLAEPR